MKIGKNLIVSGVVLTTFAIGASGNGLNLNGLGSRALAMGGAYVGLADDASAVFWNPAGAAAFDRPTLGFALADLIPSATYFYDSGLPDGPPTFLAESVKAHYLCGLGAYYRPLGRRVVVGLGIYTPSGIGAKWDGADFTTISGQAYEWTSRVGVFTISPLIAVRLTDWMSVGATVNINYGSFSMFMPAGSAPLAGDPPEDVDLGQYEESMTGWGVGATVGVLIHPVDRLGVGVTVRTASTLRFTGAARISNFPYLEIAGESGLERNVTWPLWIGAGVSFKPLEKLVLTADVQWTQWSRIEALETRYLDPTWSLILEAAGKSVRVMSWSDRAQVRLGAEYAPAGDWAFRAGFTHDPSPTPDSTMNVLLPSFDFSIVSAGVGRRVGDVRLDFCLEYLMGRDRTASPTPENMPGTYTMRILAPSMSMSYSF